MGAAAASPWACRLRRAAGGGAALAVLLGAVAAIVAPGDVAAGLELTLEDATGREWLRRPWPEASLEALAARLPAGAAEAGPLRARLEGLWHVPEAGAGELWLKAEGAAAAWLDGRELLRRPAGSPSRSRHRPWDLEAGWHRVAVELSPRGESTFAKLQWAPAGGPPRDLGAGALFRSEPAPAALQRRAAAHVLALAALTAAAASFAALALLALSARRREGRWPGWWPRALLPLLLVVVAGGLRFEAVVGQYWHVDAPNWAREAAALVSRLRPDAPRWGPQTDPYRGDPWGYLQAAREPRGLYDAHVREPVFVLATKGLLPLVGGHEVAVNLASAGFSVLAVLATYALGARAFSPAVGFWAALLLGVERRVIALGIQGWRDDAFGFFVVLSAFALVGLLRRPSPPRALLAGVAGGLACLTRITSLSFLAPGLGWLLLPPFDRRRARAVAAAALIAGGLLAPYLIACQLAYGDALYSINYHTGFYRARQGVEAGASMSWDSYVLSSGTPLATLDTLLVGLTHYPFANKWRHFEWILPGLGRGLAVAALAGLVLLGFRPVGRLLLVVLASALLPYAFTWPVPGGREWRFTLHAYPFYLLAACVAVETALRALRPAALARLRARAAAAPRRWLAAAAAAALGAGLVWTGLAGLLYLRGVEALRVGNALTLEAGLRDGFFFGEGWSRPEAVGQHRERRTRGERSFLHLPLTPGRDYDLTLRMGLAEGMPEPVAAPLRLNGTPLGELPLRFEPERLGVHHVRLPRSRVVAGRNRIEIRTGPAGARLWYFRIAPAGETGAGEGEPERDPGDAAEQFP